MALQDLTPQLRTRLSRMERAVGWFVLLATALLVFGFVYYAYSTAKRKGWFKIRVPYFTLVDRATGLRVGDPVMLMGFEVGRITRVEPTRPEDFYNVYIEFEIIEPNYGYLWTIGSRTKVGSADLLGKRVLEVTKGTNGYPIYVFNTLHQLTIEDAYRLSLPDRWRLAEDIWIENEKELTDIAVPAFTPLLKTNLSKIAALGRTQVFALDTGVERKFITAVWHNQAGRYEVYSKTNIYWLPADESPAVTERLEALLGEVENALPSFFSLTNQISGVLSNAASLTVNFDALASAARPAATNLARLSAQLREPGSLGEWLLGTKAQPQIDATLERANTFISRADTNLVALVANLARSLDNLAEITSNLNAQAQANTNILSSISKAVVDADELVQGLKRHWLLRSAFRTRATNAPAGAPAISTPRGKEQFPR